MSGSIRSDLRFESPRAVFLRATRKEDWDEDPSSAGKKTREHRSRVKRRLGIMSTMAAHPSPHTDQPSPALIFETLTAYQHSMALKGAIDLDLFTTIGDGATTAARGAIAGA